jgi:hypothetical protein
VRGSYHPPPTESSLSQEGNFPVCSGTTNQAAVNGRDCLRFGGSGSDFAEEPAARVQSQPRRL